MYVYRRLRFSSDADIVRLTNARIIIIIIIIKIARNRQFSHPRVFNAPDEGVPLGILDQRRGLRKLE